MSGFIFAALVAITLVPVRAQPQPSGTVGTLASGETVSGTLQDAENSVAYHTYTFQIPNGTRRLTIALEGGGNDLDLAVKSGSEIVSYLEDGYDHGDFTDEPNPVVVLVEPNPGVLYIDVVNSSDRNVEYAMTVRTETALLAAQPRELWHAEIAGLAATGVAIDADGSVYLAGPTGAVCSICSDRPLAPSSGFMMKFDRDGTKLWEHGFGSEGDDGVAGVATNGTSQPIVAATAVWGTGGRQAYVSQVDRHGAGVRYWGVDASESAWAGPESTATSVATDANGLTFVVGQVGRVWSDSGLFMTKFDREGSQLWFWGVQHPGVGYVAGSVAPTGAGGAYAAFSQVEVRADALGRRALWLAGMILTKLDGDGRMVWTRFLTLGADDEVGVTAEVDVGSGGDVYVVVSRVGPNRAVDDGDAYGVFLPRESFGIFLLRESADGEQLWARSIADRGVLASGIVVDDARETVYVVGMAGFDLAGTGHAGGADPFLAAFDLDGELRWARQYGSERHDRVVDVAVDDAGGLAFAWTDGRTTHLVRLGH